MFSYHSVRIAKDTRTWSQRIKSLDKNWAPHIDAMIDSYIHWKYNDPPEIQAYKDIGTYPAVDGFDFDITVIDLHDLNRVVVIPRDGETSAAVALVKAGYLGTSPETPSLAISLRTLDHYYTLRQFKPTFSLEAFAKVVCHTYWVSFLSIKNSRY